MTSGCILFFFFFFEGGGGGMHLSLYVSGAWMSVSCECFVLSGEVSATGW